MFQGHQYVVLAYQAEKHAKIQQYVNNANKDIIWIHCLHALLVQLNVLLVFSIPSTMLQNVLTV